MTREASRSQADVADDPVRFRLLYLTNPIADIRIKLTIKKFSSEKEYEQMIACQNSEKLQYQFHNIEYIEGNHTFSALSGSYGYGSRHLVYILRICDS